MTPARYLCDVAGVPVHEWAVSAGVAGKPSVVEHVKSSNPRSAIEFMVEEMRSRHGEDRTVEAETHGEAGEVFRMEVEADGCVTRSGNGWWLHPDCRNGGPYLTTLHAGST